MCVCMFMFICMYMHTLRVVCVLPNDTWPTMTSEAVEYARAWSLGAKSSAAHLHSHPRPPPIPRHNHNWEPGCC